MGRAPKRRATSTRPPFETEQLRAKLSEFFQTPFPDPSTGTSRTLGSFKWGVYLFYDYDGEPIYAGQTREQLSQRVGRHLTGQRSDSVAKSVLDPFEVFEIEVWPIPQFQNITSNDEAFESAKQHLNALEFQVHQQAIANSKFGAILNEEDPAAPIGTVPMPQSVRGRVVTDEVLKLRGHPDTRLARRALTLSRLAQTISERQVDVGLRRTLLMQARRLRELAEARFLEFGGQAAVEKKPENADEEGDD
jgi:hypothetical protein